MKSMEDPEHLEILKQGREVWNKWRGEHPDIIPVLREADLRKANLSYADLSYADLSYANLSRVDLEMANLWRANLGGADLGGANLWIAKLSEASLWRANLKGADLRSAELRGADLRWTDLTGANLKGVALERANLIKTNFTDANLTGCRIYGIAAWDVQLEGAKQENLRITPIDQPNITVDNLEVAQFIHLLLNNKKIRNVLNSVTEKGVLLLGRFSDGGLDLLQAIAAKLRAMKYLPIIFDFDRPDNKNYTETVKTLVGLSRFVIADLSGSSVPQELYSTVPHFKIPFVPIIEESRNTYAMFTDLLEYPWVLSPVTFKSTEQLVALLPEKVIAPAEEKFQERQLLLEQLFGDKGGK
jgi:uncharacterized protein YjbI with pentapeptide repeats